MFLLAITDLEQIIYNNSVAYVFGGREMIGIFTVIFFFGFVLLQQTRLDHKLMVFMGATILGAAFFDPLRLFLGLVFGILLFIAYKKVFDR